MSLHADEISGILDHSVLDIRNSIGQLTPTEIRLPENVANPSWRQTTPLWTIAQLDVDKETFRLRDQPAAPQLVFSPFSPFDFPFLFGMTIRLLPPAGTLATAAVVLKKHGINILAAELEARGQNHHTLRFIGLDERIRAKHRDNANRERDQRFRAEIAIEISQELRASLTKLDESLRNENRQVPFLYENRELLPCEYVPFQQLASAWRDMNGEAVEFRCAGDNASIMPVDESKFRRFFAKQYDEYGIRFDAVGRMSFDASERYLLVTVGRTEKDLALDELAFNFARHSANLEAAIILQRPPMHLRRPHSDNPPPVSMSSSTADLAKAKLPTMKKDVELVEVAFHNRNDFRAGLELLNKDLQHIGYFVRGQLRLGVERWAVPEMLEAGINIKPTPD